jgi:hypothetical protein
LDAEQKLHLVYDFCWFRSGGTLPDGTVRFSLGYFNTLEDVEIAIKAVRKIAMKWNHLKTRELQLGPIVIHLFAQALALSLRGVKRRSNLPNLEIVTLRSQ